MVLKPDQERVKGLLKDTIALLCKNGLDFKEEFSIDAVIGVTLDRDNLFYISMTETIKANKPMNIHEADDQSGDSESSLGERRGRKRKKERRRSSSVASDNDEENEQQYSEQFNDAAKQQQSQRKRLSSGMPVKEEINDEDDEIMIVKEEPRESWSQDGETDQYLQDMTFENFPNQSAGTSSGLSQSASSFLNASDLGSLSNIPGDTEDGSSAVWPGGFRIGASQLQHVPPRPTSDNSPSQPELSQGSMDQGLTSSNLCCYLCHRQFNSMGNLKRHIAAHYGKHAYQCSHCNKGFSSKGNLLGHIAGAHTGRKQFKCNICSKECNYKANLKAHMLKLHGIQD